MIQENFKVNEKLWEIGVIDDRDVPFHRLLLTKGTTYNSYFYNTQKPTVIDSVDMMYGKNYVENLSKKINLDNIYYIVVNHTEPDHSGALGLLVRKAKNAKIVCSEKAVEHLKEVYKITDREFIVVKTGDSIDIGGKTLSFYNVPNLHTEETIMTYCKEDKILFSCDIFSTHIATTKATNTMELNSIDEDYSVYYDLIFSPHRIYVLDLLKFVDKLDIELIAPSHGYILDKDIKHFIDIYREKSKTTTEIKKATVVYTTMRGNTRKIARYIAEKLSATGRFDVSIFDADKTPHSEILDSISTSELVLVGSATKYGDMIGSLDSLLKSLPSLEGKTTAAFGSFAWSGEAIEIIGDYLRDASSHYLTTSETIKKTGCMEYEFPLRLRYNLSEDNMKKVDSAITYLESILN
ncbi:MAG: FprA family A-type flavoprotein [Sphaerochaetaceae bacterium]|nr:FprA family A-type flavoprotein [Sphaerochaetaceae bacterium]